MTDRSRAGGKVVRRGRRQARLQRGEESGSVTPRPVLSKRFQVPGLMVRPARSREQWSGDLTGNSSLC